MPPKSVVTETADSREWIAAVGAQHWRWKCDVSVTKRSQGPKETIAGQCLTRARSQWTWDKRLLRGKVRSTGEEREQLLLFSLSNIIWRAL